jgi:glycosyltransferase involved in cell wall biosynthesis
MKRILIDLTDIEGWHGHHGGTQRVVYGIAKQFFLKDGQEFQVEFMAFSAHENIFYKTSFAPILHRVENQETTSSHQQSQQLAITVQSRVKHFVRPYVPEKLRKNKRARATAKSALLQGKSIARKAKQKIRGHSQSLKSLSSHRKIRFTENDIVLVLGKPWDNPTMERTLINAKADKGFILVQAIYDLIIPLYPHLHHPSLFKTYTQYMFEAIYSSDLLLPISKSTEKDLILFARSLNLPVPKTKVIRLADEIVNQHDENSKPDSQIADKFIACVGTVEIRKNHTLLYYTYKLAESRGIELPQLVIVGSRGWLTGDFQYLVEHDPKLKNKIIILDTINDQGLSWIYANCMFSMYPSFYEGWGLPVAESLANGKLCIASDSSSIPEICGDITDYFSPYNAQACLDLMVTYLDSAKLQQKEAQIKQTYKSTSWDDTFSQVTDGLSHL